MCRVCMCMSIAIGNLFVFAHGVWGYIHKPYRFNDYLCFVSSMYMHLILIDITYFISLVLIKMIEELEFQ